MNPVTNIIISNGMKIDLEPNKYTVAVSGGVDSVVLLDILYNKKQTYKDRPCEFVVAHFDHGIRLDSKDNCDFVSHLAQKYELKFYYEQGNLGITASEETARKARYNFLQRIKNKTQSKAIITAHHQDDVTETALINMIRGTTARGLGSLKNTTEIVRPLLNFSKKEIIEYATSQNLKWREDETNNDEKYLRNYIRLNIIPKMSDASGKKLIHLIQKSQVNQAEIDSEIEILLDVKKQIKRSEFVVLPHAVSCELIASILRNNKLKIDKKTIERLVVSLKTAAENKKIEINSKHSFLINNGQIKLVN